MPTFKKFAGCTARGLLLVPIYMGTYCGTAAAAALLCAASAATRSGPKGSLRHNCTGVHLVRGQASNFHLYAVAAVPATEGTGYPAAVADDVLHAYEEQARYLLPDGYKRPAHPTLCLLPTWLGADRAVAAPGHSVPPGVGEDIAGWAANSPTAEAVLKVAVGGDCTKPAVPGAVTITASRNTEIDYVPAFWPGRGYPNHITG